MNSESFNFIKFSDKQNDLFNWWRKNKDKDMVIADGAIRSGKTVSMICSFLVWSLFNFKNKKFIIAGQNIGSLEKNVINPMIDIITEWGLGRCYSYNRSKNFIVFGSNTYYMYGACNELSYKALQGLTAAGALADEVALFPQSFTDQMIGRCSVEGSKIFFNCNPAGPYHYFKTEYLDKKEEKQIYHLHFTMDDNLSLSESIKERYKRTFSGVFYKRYILGEWVMAEGIIYDMFNENIHVINTSGMKFEKYYISIDYGVQNAFSAGLWGTKKEFRENLETGKTEKVTIGYRLKEFYYSGRDTKKQLDNEAYYQRIVDLAGNLNIQEIIIDPSATSFVVTIKKHGKFGVRNAKNDKKEGIENTSTALNTKRLFIDKNCKDIIKEFHSYSWDEKAIDKGKDVPKDINNHACDDCRYFVNTVMFNSVVDFRNM